MRRQQRIWHLRRTGVPTATGQQRWDRAYQLLLRWAVTPPSAQAEVPEPPKGSRHERGGLLRFFEHSTINCGENASLNLNHL